MAQDKLKLIPLGGLGEFGMNCMALRWQDDIIVIDAGLMFPEEELLGVDIVVPDISYLTEKIPGKRLTLGPFSVMPIRVTHSLVDCVALAIHTPVGVVLHTGDFKVDLSPPDNKPFDLHSFAELGKQGVLVLLQDSTNVDRSGYTPSERAVRPRLDEIFSQTKKKLFFSCFSSSIHRIRLAMELAHQHGRKVAVVGRSLDNSTEIAQDLGYLDLPQGLVINPGQIRDTPANK